MKVLGMCGGSGAGKGYVCGLFAARGVPSIDTDSVYREMTKGPSPCMKELAEAFGSGILCRDGSLDRRAMASIVFAPNGEADLKRLNAITHKYIKTETEKAITQYRAEGRLAVIVDAPALFESGFDRLCDAVIGVFAPRELRIARIIQRDGITREQAEARLAKQIPDEVLMPRCDYCVSNGGEDVESQVDRILSEIAE